MAPTTPFSFNTPQSKPSSSSTSSSSSFFTPPPQSSFQLPTKQPPFTFNPSTSNSTFTPKRPSHLANSIPAGVDAKDDNLMGSANGTGTGTGTGSQGADGDDDEEVATCYLQPPAYGRSTKDKWIKSGRGFGAGVCPVGGEVVAWVNKRTGKDPNAAPILGDKNLTLADRTLYFANAVKLTSPVEDLYTETYTLFTSLQSIVYSSLNPKLIQSLNGGVDRAGGQSRGARGFGVAERWDDKGRLIGAQGLSGPPDGETVSHMRRLVDLYLEEVLKLKVNSDVDEDTRIRFDAVYHVLHLAEILYLPQDGRGEGLLGEELLDWVNAVDTAPNNEQGNEIMQIKEPYRHPSFWPYITRCLLRGFHLPASSFLRTLQSHPHPPISKLALLLSTHLSLFPRSHNTTSYTLDHQFLAAHKTWLGRFGAELASFVGGKPRGQWFETGDHRSSGRSEWASWEDDFATVIELMEGRTDRVLEESADWREAMGAWGILVDVGLRRDDVPSVLAQILDRIPVDSTILDDSIQSSLCSGDIVKALMGCHDLDIWLSAHLGDVFDKLALVPDDEERFDTALRDYFLLEYTDLLQTHPRHSAMWRITCDYLDAAGPEGRNQLREYIQHVALGLDNEVQGKQSGTVQAESNGMDIVVEGIDEQEEKESMNLRRFTEVREACAELRLEDEWKIISKVVADRLIRRGDYGLAAAMCLQAEDGYTLSRIAEEIVEAYLSSGDEEFLRLVDTLPPTLLAEAPVALTELQPDLPAPTIDGLPNQSSMSVFASRLTFLSEFRDYLLFVQQGVKDRAAARLVNLLISGIAPAAFWAVLLVESITLLEDEEILFSSNDTFELLRVLEEVSSNSTYAPSEYLSQVERHLDRQRSSSASSSKQQKSEEKVENGNTRVKSKPEGEKYVATYRKLEEVRLALGRNLARALVVGFDNPF